MNFQKHKTYFVSLGIIVLLLSIVVIACNSKENKIETTEPTTVVFISPSPEVTETPEVTEMPTEVPTETPEPTPEYISLGEFRLTAYCSCTKCCGKWGESRPLDAQGNPIVITASGARAVAGVTIAADTNVLPFGTKVYIDGHEYIVQDRGGAIKENRIDIYFDSHQEALNFGVQYKEVFIKNN
jgi:3D (Asp-Asp-Asp) domain-containing protein